MIEDKGKWFFTSDTAKERDRSKIVSVPTGIHPIDRKIIGLNKQEISVFSGFRTAGKSTILTQIALQVVQSNKKVAMFSGEMNEARVFEWTYLIAAGRTYTMPTDNENYFRVLPEARDAIKQWLNQKMFVYNNRYGNDMDVLFSMMEYCIKTKEVDVLILDNLMSIDIGSSDTNKNSKQTEFIWKVKHFAEDTNTHVILVVHPRKTNTGILRIDDISGTADLTNAADNVFLLHRVGFDFKRNAKALFHWSDDYAMFQVNNILEVAKNRDLGVMDEMAGLYYDHSSKQMTDDQKEICYSWRNNLKGVVESDVGQQAYWN
jgi:replicative DNA helicase